MAAKKVTGDSVIIFSSSGGADAGKPPCDNDGYRGIFENALIGIFKTTVGGAILDINPTFARMFGYESSQKMLDDVADASRLYLNPEDRTRIIDTAISRGGVLSRWECVFRRKDGSAFTGMLNLKVILGKDGKPTHVEGCLEDITDEKLMRESIVENEEKFRGVFEESPVGLVIFDGIGRLLSANQSCIRMLGVPNISEVIGFRLFDLPYMSERTRERLTSGVTVRKDIEFDLGEISKRGLFKTTKNEVLYLDVSIKPLGHDENKPPTSYLLQVQDITDRKRMEDTLRRTQRQQKALLDNIPDIAWLKDKESRFIAVNEPFGRSCGYKPEDVAGKTDLDIWPKELADGYMADDREVMDSGKRKRVEEPLADKEGRMQWIETIKTPMYDERGNVVGTAGIARDITDRKRFEEELHLIRAQLEARVRALTEELETVKDAAKRVAEPNDKSDDKQTTLL